MKKNFSLILFTIICLAINIKTSAHNYPSKPTKQEVKKEDSPADIIFSEAYINHTFSSAIYFQRGLHRLEMNEYETAVSDFNKAIDLFPFNADAYLQRAYAKKLLGQQEEAIEDYQLAAYLNPVYKDMVF